MKFTVHYNLLANFIVGSGNTSQFSAVYGTPVWTISDEPYATPIFPHQTRGNMSVDFKRMQMTP